MDRFIPKILQSIRYLNNIIAFSDFQGKQNIALTNFRIGMSRIHSKNAKFFRHVEQYSAFVK